MKIEAGKFYRTREGVKVGPMTMNSRRVYIWESENLEHPWTWDNEGSELRQHETCFDIVAKWTDGPDPQDYTALRDVLDAALQQAAEGKGAERHAAGLPFDQQPIATITRRRGVGFPLGQAEKKINEAHGMAQRGDPGAAEHDLLGAIVYLAAAVLAIRDGVK